MTDPLTGGADRVPTRGAASFRVAVIDTDTVTVEALTKRMGRLRWEHIILASPVPIVSLVALRLGALVVDVEVLGQHAWPYLGRVCGELPDLGIVVCTRPSTVAQRVRGLRLGVDDWVAKPCHPDELIARVEAVVRRRRRAEAAASEQPIRAGELELRPSQFQVFVNGRSAELTKMQFELVALLAVAEGRVLEREEIYQRVWGYALARGDRSVDVFVRKLRVKLERASPGWRYIHTRFGSGYSFSVEPADGAPE